MSVETITALEIFDRVVCGVDGSVQALEAARQAARLRSPKGTLRLAAVTEVNTAVHAGFAMSHVLTELDAASREGLRRAIGAGEPASAQLLEGSASGSLLEEIERTNATLVSFGPRGHSRAAGMLVGGVATELLHKAPCSVLFAREPRFGKFPSSIIVCVDGSEHSLAAANVAESLAERFGSELVIVAARCGKGIEIEPLGRHADRSVTRARPLVARQIAIELDAVAVGIAQVERFDHAVIGCAVQFDARREHAVYEVGPEVAAREECGVVLQCRPEEEDRRRRELGHARLERG